MKRSICAVFGALVLTTTATACGGDDSSSADGTTPADVTTTASSAGDTPSTAAPAGTGGGNAVDEQGGCTETVPGSELTFAAYSSTGQLDPTLIAGGVVGGTEIGAIYDELFTYNYDTKQVEPHLAKSITSNDDLTEFTLELREGITYSDGTPLDAQMVSDNIDRYHGKHATAPHGTFLKLIERKEVVDPLTLRITMSRPWAEFPSFLAEQVGMIVNTNAIGNDVQAFAANPPDAAGVGPYVLQRNAPGEEIVLEARDDYWGGPVCIETLRIINISGPRATYDAFRNGEIDAAFLRDPVVINEAEADGVSGEFRNTDIGQSLMLNLTDGHAAADPRLREAIWLAMDPEIINERVFEGQFASSMSLIHPDSAFASDSLDTVEHDPERARQLVQDAEADGVEASLELSHTSRPPAPDSALAWQGMLEAVGFEVTTNSAPLTEFIPHVFQGNFDGAGWSLDIESAQLTTRLHGALHSTGENNRGRYASDEMDAALLDAMAAPTDERAEAVAAINDIFVKDFVYPVFGSNRTGIIWQDDVHGITANPTVIYLFHDAYIDG